MRTMHLAQSPAHCNDDDVLSSQAIISMPVAPQCSRRLVASGQISVLLDQWICSLVPTALPASTSPLV